MNKLAKFIGLPILRENRPKTYKSTSLELVDSDFMPSKASKPEKLKVKFQNIGLQISSKKMNAPLEIRHEAIRRIEIIPHQPIYKIQKRYPFMGGLFFGFLGWLATQAWMINFSMEVQAITIVGSVLFGAILNVKDHKVQKNLIDNSIVIHYDNHHDEPKTLTLHCPNNKLQATRGFFHKYFAHKTKEVAK